MLDTFYVGLFFTILSIAITWFYSLHQNKIAHEQMLKQLFTEFNSRYDLLNEFLSEIEKNYYNSDLLIDDKRCEILKQKTIDYFNLCAEEYFWYKKKRIDQKIWDAWSAGMQHWYKVPAIQALWDSEIKESCRSYYITNGNEFFIKN